jgi:hypothetical protein
MEVGSCRETDEIKSAVNIEDTVAIVLTTQKQHYLETGPNPGSFPMKPSTASSLKGEYFSSPCPPSAQSIEGNVLNDGAGPSQGVYPPAFPATLHR